MRNASFLLFPLFILLTFSLLFPLLPSPIVDSSTPDVVSEEVFLPRSSFFSSAAEVNFTLSLNSSQIKRGIDDLILFFHLSWLNGSSVGPGATIFYNITHDVSNVIENAFIDSNSSLDYKVVVDKKEFFSQPSGNYSVNSFVNGTNVIPSYQTVNFTLSVLPSGQIEMTFPTNKIILERNATTDVEFQLINVGGSKVMNVTISASINRQGTDATPVIYLPTLSLALESGESFKGTIRYFTNEPLYQKHSYQVIFTNLDDPDNPVYVLSEPLYLVCYPNITVTNVHFSVNASLDEEYLVSYIIKNYETDTVYISHEVVCPLIPFTDVNGEIIAISPSFSGHHVDLTDKPIASGNTTISLSIQIVWITQTGVNWFTSFYDSGVFTIQIVSNHEPLNPFDERITIIVLLVSILFGIGYFSRDVVKGLVKMTRGEKEKTFPETSYPFDVVIVDGSNVAWEEKDSFGHPKLSNIEAMINKLSRANFKKIITVADAALRYQIDDQKRLDQLVKEGAIKMLPARVDGDKFILRIAEEEKAMIVSNDLFKEFREIAPWIDKRRIPFTILDGEVFLHPTAESPDDNVSKINSAFEN